MSERGKEGHLKVGKVGEEVAAKFLVQNGFEIKERNYSKKWGELDIVAVKNGKLHFVEVKTVSWDSLRDGNGGRVNQYRPEDNMHPQKLKRLARVTESYLASKRRAGGMPWQFDVAAVFLDLEHRIAKVKMLWDLILPAR
ncbi:MAG: YraN family protein [bacterium]|nr:YraN family protein [bacterium]